MSVTNAVMLVRDRPELTRQAVTTMFEHAAPGSFNLVIVDDGSTDRVRDIVETFSCAREGCVALRMNPGQRIVGLCRNLGILASERVFGRGEFLYLSDSDAYFLPGWLDTLTAAFKESEPHGIRLLGGCTHPFHGINRRGFLAACPITAATIGTHDAVQGLSQLMRWETWDKYGPFDAHAHGTNQSEDFAFCQKIVKDGFLVGSVYPRVVLNCGLLDSYGKPCVGYDAVKAELLGEIRARGLEGKVYYPTMAEGAGAHTG